MILEVTKELNFGEVSANEIKRKGISYTIDTVNYYKSEYPQSELFFFIGSDSIENFDSWFKVDDIINKCNIIIYSRFGYEELEILIKKTNFTECQKNNLLENSIFISKMNISSTKIRMAVESRKKYDHLVPVSVKNYIEMNRLYRINK